MKRRPSREISIFSLSMLDVISGAMGAFLIIMIILSRYYENDPANRKSVEELQNSLQRSQQKLEQIEKLIRNDPSAQNFWEQLQQALQQLSVAQGKLHSLEQLLNQAAAQKRRLETENSSLRQSNDSLQKENSSLSLRKPYLTLIDWDCPGLDLDLYVQTEVATAAGAKMPPFDPQKKQSIFFDGDFRVDDRNSPGTEAWITRDSVEEVQYKIYISAYQPPANFATCRVSSYVFGSFPTQVIPFQLLSPSRPWVFVGRLIDQRQGAPLFREATEEERRKEYEAARTS